jgi:hypothetical protein
MTPQRLTELSIGYDLDCGGYEFDNAPPELGEHVVTLDSDMAIKDLGPFERDDFWGLSCPVFAFAPMLYNHKFPESYPGPWDDTTMVKAQEGTLYETDRECHCHGKLVEWCGAAGEPLQPLPREAARRFVQVEVKIATGTDSAFTAMGPLFFKHTGNVMDAPYPDCNRCDGDGYVESPGGTWALYALENEKDDE